VRVRVPPPAPMDILRADTPENVTEFSWIDLAGNGKYALVMVQMPDVCHICKTLLLIFQQSHGGIITMQVLPGSGPLSKVVRDLNGDGKKELIIPLPAPNPDWQSFGAVTQIISPRVYRSKTESTWRRARILQATTTRKSCRRSKMRSLRRASVSRMDPSERNRPSAGCDT
jgi:hypothetical protein